MSAIYENAIDTLRIGFEFFRKESSYSSRKHAILTVFHAIELFFKEHLFRINRVLIYKNIDAKITDDSQTVGVREILVRFENIGVKLPPEQTEAIAKIQKIRNRIEHHRFTILFDFVLLMVAVGALKAQIALAQRSRSEKWQLLAQGGHRRGLCSEAPMLWMRDPATITR